MQLILHSKWYFAVETTSLALQWRKTRELNYKMLNCSCYKLKKKNFDFMISTYRQLQMARKVPANRNVHLNTMTSK